VGNKKAMVFKVQSFYATHGGLSDGHQCRGWYALPVEIPFVAIKLALTKGCEEDGREVSIGHSSRGNPTIG
jgi:hypothetical protein